MGCFVQGQVMLNVVDIHLFAPLDSENPGRVSGQNGRAYWVLAGQIW